jgi:hypothetical protein
LNVLKIDVSAVEDKGALTGEVKLAADVQVIRLSKTQTALWDWILRSKRSESRAGESTCLLRDEALGFERSCGGRDPGTLKP